MHLASPRDLRVCAVARAGGHGATKSNAFFVSTLLDGRRSQVNLCFLQHPASMTVGRQLFNPILRRIAVFSQEPTPITVSAKLHELLQDEMLAAPIFFVSLFAFWAL